MVILCAEDDAAIRSYLVRLLKANGFTVLAAENGKTALEASRNYTGSIELLLSDVMMPGMDGLELRKNILAERPETKVLMMSGYTDRCEEISVAGLPFIQKPFTPTDLRRSITSLLGSCPNPQSEQP